MLAVLFMAAMSMGQAQNVPITLNQGWNWISYPYARPMTIQEALTGFTPLAGDVISSQTNGSATYLNGQWRGNLTTLIPGQGYMYKSMDGTTRSFIFGGPDNDPSHLPYEALTGEFTVNSSGNKVRFSPGNLQCRRDPNQEVQAKIGTFSENSTHMPYDTYYRYSLCQMIYKAQELYAMGLVAGSITSIAFQSPDFYQRNNVEIWMSATTATTASSTSQSTSGMTRVFNGTVTFQGLGDFWIEIPFTTSFDWDGTSNVMVTVVMNHGSWDSSTDWFCCSPGFTCSSYAYNDSNGAYYPSSNTYSMTTSTLRPLTLFKGHGGATWRFAEKQWDYIGEGNALIASSYTGWIDLFGWGTSGHDHGAVCYQPWSTSQTNSDYYAYGSYTYNLNDQSGRADWGCNAIGNGGNQPYRWRTLTQPEWYYIFNTRSTTSGKRYAKAQVNGVNGMILLPDNWQTSYYSLNSTNTYNSNFSTNIITSSQWSTLEQHGAVFLPAAGDRGGTSLYDVGTQGVYQTATYGDEQSSKYISFNNGAVNFNSYNRRAGRSVRLVCQSNPRIRTLSVTNGIGSATVSAEVDYTGSSTVTERGICYTNYTKPDVSYMSSVPTVSGHHQASGSGTGCFYVQLTRENATFFSDFRRYFKVRAYAKIGGTYYYGNILEFEMTDDGSNGKAGVDLGLPSGTLWATRNVGADNPEDYGNYFAWGEIRPKSDYSWSTYKYTNGGTSYLNSCLTKYCVYSSCGYNGFVDNITTLLPEDDPATDYFGGDWRLPTKEEWEELRSNTTKTLETVNGVNGIRFTGPNGNSIFLPAAGYYEGNSLHGVGDWGRYWSSSLYYYKGSSYNFSSGAYYDGFKYSTGGNTWYNGYRIDGYSVRPVRTPRRN